MHWCSGVCIPRLLTGSFTHLTNSKTESASTGCTAKSLNTCSENSRRDWQNIKMATTKTTSKSAFIVPFPQHKRFTDTKA